MKPTLSTLLVAASILPALAAQNDIRGVSFAGGTYALNSTTGAGNLLGASGVAGMNAMAKVGNTLVTVSSSGGLYAIDPFTGVGTLLASTSPALTSVRGLATSLTGVLYALQNGGGTTVADLLYTIDVGTGVATLVGSTSHSGLQGLAGDLLGNLYSWDVGTGSGVGVGLVTVDPVSAVSIDIDPTIGNAVDVQCLAVSPTNVLYGGRNSLFTIDTTNGAATLVGTGGYTDLRGMEFVPPASCTVFNGSSINPVVCSCATAPVLGASWNFTVAPAATTVLTLVFLAASPLPGPVPLFGGEALIAPPVVDIGSTGFGAHSVLLPADATLAGFPLYAQGLRLNATAGLTIELTNGLAAVLGF